MRATDARWVAIRADSPGELDAIAVLTRCVESGARAVLVEDDSLPDEFFDLSTRVLGELLHKLGQYRIRLAGVVPDPSTRPVRFQEFVRETNRGEACRFFPSRDAAVAWLESERA